LDLFNDQGILKHFSGLIFFQPTLYHGISGCIENAPKLLSRENPSFVDKYSIKFHLEWYAMRLTSLLSSVFKKGEQIMALHSSESWKYLHSGHLAREVVLNALLSAAPYRMLAKRSGFQALYEGLSVTVLCCYQRF
jgi:hypothetical protein